MVSWLRGGGYGNEVTNRRSGSMVGSWVVDLVLIERGIFLFVFVGSMRLFIAVADTQRCLCSKSGLIIDLLFCVGNVAVASDVV